MPLQRSVQAIPPSSSSSPVVAGNHGNSSAPAPVHPVASGVSHDIIPLSAPVSCARLALPERTLAVYLLFVVFVLTKTNVRSQSLIARRLHGMFTKTA